MKNYQNNVKRGLFVHDGPVYVDEYKSLYANSYPSEIINSYFRNDELQILTRVVETKKYKLINKYRKIEFCNISFIKMHDHTGLKNFFKNKLENKNNIKKAVKEADYLVIRLPSFFGNSAIKYAKKYNKPYIVEVVGNPLASYWYHSLLGKVIAPYMFFKTFLSIYKSNYVIYVTQKYLSNLFPTKGETAFISDVIINEDIYNYGNKRNIDKSIIRLGTIGNVDVKYKGQHKVIKTLKKLNQKNKDKTYIYEMVGGGNTNYLESLSQKYKVNEFIKFKGNLPNESVLSWLNEIDIYLQPSDLEGLPRSVIEAMSQGVPVIATSVGGIPELIEKEQLLSKINQKRNLIRKINKLTPLDMENIGRNNFNKSKKYSFPKLIKQREEFVKKFKKDNLMEKSYDEY